ncbi:hypothetical protein ACFQV8_35365 [Pseudonocardia benzenivorans]
MDGPDADDERPPHVDPVARLAAGRADTEARIAGSPGRLLRWPTSRPSPPTTTSTTPRA